MKKIISVLTALMVLCCLTVSAFAADQHPFKTDEESEFDESYYVESTESKPICPATLDDDFAPDRVIVLLSHAESIKRLHTDSIPDVFNDLDLASVKEMFNDYTRSIRERYAGFVTEYLEVADDSLSPTEKQIFAEQMATKRIDALYENYHKYYLLTLNVKNKQAVLDTIRILEKSNDVYVAEPDYIVHENLDGNNGDADKDGDLTILDATHIQLYKAELIEESEIDLIAADYDADGDVTVLDATRIQRYKADICELDGTNIEHKE